VFLPRITRISAKLLDFRVNSRNSRRKILILDDIMADILYKELSFAVIGAAMEVPKILGPGFLETVYQLALEKELTLRAIPFLHQVELPVTYKGDLVGVYKADLIVDHKIILEIKGISKLNASHAAQALHYLAATGLQLAILVNFGMGSSEDRRVVKSENRSSRQHLHSLALPEGRVEVFVAKKTQRENGQSYFSIS
jgi:GxxExxY protein